MRHTWMKGKHDQWKASHAPSKKHWDNSHTSMSTSCTNKVFLIIFILNQLPNSLSKNLIITQKNPIWKYLFKAWRFCFDAGKIEMANEIAFVLMRGRLKGFFLTRVVWFFSYTTLIQYRLSQSNIFWWINVSRCYHLQLNLDCQAFLDWCLPSYRGCTKSSYFIKNYILVLYLYLLFYTK
jgi:hypothetical protein